MIKVSFVLSFPHQTLQTLELTIIILELANDGDRLEIYDGNDDGARQLANLTAMSIPEPYRSTSNVVYITMKTDDALTSNGFKLTWSKFRYISIH